MAALADLTPEARAVATHALAQLDAPAAAHAMGCFLERDSKPSAEFRESGILLVEAVLRALGKTSPAALAGAELGRLADAFGRTLISTVTADHPEAARVLASYRRKIDASAMARGRKLYAAIERACTAYTRPQDEPDPEVAELVKRRHRALARRATVWKRTAERAEVPARLPVSTCADCGAARVPILLLRLAIADESLREGALVSICTSDRCLDGDFSVGIEPAPRGKPVGSCDLVSGQVLAFAERDDLPNLDADAFLALRHEPTAALSRLEGAAQDAAMAAYLARPRQPDVGKIGGHASYPGVARHGCAGSRRRGAVDDAAFLLQFPIPRAICPGAHGAGMLQVWRCAACGERFHCFAGS